MTASFFRGPAVSTTTAALLLLSCNRPANTLNLPTITGNPGTLHLSFNGTSPAQTLSDADSDAAPSPPLPSSSPPSETEPSPGPGDPRERDRPAFAFRTDQGCLFARPAFYHRQEYGLRLSYCSGDIRAELQTYVLSAFQAPAQPMAVFRAGEIEAGVLGPGTPGQHLGPVNTLYCERDCNRFEDWPATVRILSTAMPAADQGNMLPTWLPRRFYDSGFNLAIREESFTLLYSLPESNRLLYVRVSNPHASNEIRSFLREKTLEAGALLQSASTGGIFVSGAYPARLGGSGKERLILSSGEVAAVLPFEVDGKESTLFLMPRSTFVFRRDSPPGFRYTDEPNLHVNGISLLPDSQALAQGLPGRVLTRAAADASFAPGAPCLIEDPCSPEDLHPSLFALFPDQGLPDCTPENVHLTEINPFGLIRQKDGPLDPGGKFVELKIDRQCFNRTLELDVGSVRIPLPLRLPAGLIVLAASSRFFETPVVENSTLRQIHPDTVLIRDSSTAQNYSLNPAIHYIPGTRTDASFLGRVHSLLYSPGGFVFHESGDESSRESSPEPGCQGLLRQLCSNHAMTPGFSDSEARAEDPIQDPKLFLSEEVPFGSQRFLEFFCIDCHGQRGLLWFRVLRDSDQKQDVYAMPVPRANRLTLAPAPVCSLPEIQRVHFADLYIPAQAHRITSPTEEVVVDTATYSLLKQELRSLVRLPDNTFAPSTDPIPATCTVHSTPGEGTPWAGGQP